jgi:hypothetical protein
VVDERATGDPRCSDRRRDLEPSRDDVGERSGDRSGCRPTIPAIREPVGGLA